jgi:chemotaxis signal transduction protein
VRPGQRQIRRTPGSNEHVDTAIDMDPAPIEQAEPHPESGVSGTPVLRFRERIRLRAGVQDLLVVRVGGERFALPVEAVDELVESPRTQAVPGASPSLIGVFPLGDRLLSLYAPDRLLGASLSGDPVALVMRSGARVLALAVDDAEDVVRVDLKDVRDPPRVGRDDDLVLGVLWRAPDLVAVLDARAVAAACAALGATVS